MALMAVIAVTAFVWLLLTLSGWVQRRIGARGQAIVTGLVLVAIGAQLLLGGVGKFFGLVAAGRPVTADGAPH